VTLFTDNFGLDLYSGEYYIVEVELETDKKIKIIHELNLDVVSKGIGGKIEIVADSSTIELLNQQGLQHSIRKVLSPQFIPEYPSYEDLESQLIVWNTFFPDITKIYEIGQSQEYDIPIYAMKVSDNPNIKEDETVVWFDGVHHAREPMGLMSCWNLLEHLILNYGNDSLVTKMVNELEIWVVPILNTEGYKYFIDNTSESPWWRKNQRDNNENNNFDFDYDGVDLNRNYNSNWDNSSAGSSDPSSWVYKGSNPFSEHEARAKRNRVLLLRPIAGITYHSYGEIIYYNSGIKDTWVPETYLIDDFASQIAQRIPQQDGTGTYSLGPDWGTAPMSYHWMYQVAGTWEFLVETGREFVPSYSTAQQIAADNLGGALYVLEKSLAGPGIKGHVVSSYDNSAIDAEVKINEFWTPGLTPRRTESTYGRFNRFTDVGTYTLEINAPGYKSKTINNISVSSGWTDVEVSLDPFSILDISGIEMDDDSEGASLGNGNSLINSGEQIEFDITVRNTGLISSKKTEASLQVYDSYVTLLDGFQILPPIEPNSSTTAEGAFVINISRDCPDFHKINLNFTVSDFWGTPWEKTVQYTVHSSGLAVSPVESYSNGLKPKRYALFQNYPNPFNLVTTLRYDLPERTHVAITIYDLTGQQTKTLIYQIQDAGYKSIVWDGTDELGIPVSTGVYLFQIRTGGFVQTLKMVLLQ